MLQSLNETVDEAQRIYVEQHAPGTYPGNLFGTIVGQVVLDEVLRRIERMRQESQYIEERGILDELATELKTFKEGN